MSAPTHLTHQDQMLAQKAQQDHLKTSAVWDFVVAHVVNTYQLQHGDTFDTATGIINRAEATGNEDKAPEVPKKKAKRLPKSNSPEPAE